MRQPEESDRRTQGQTRQVPNVWSLDHGRNPYLHNIFALLGIDPDADFATLNNHLNLIERQIKAGQNVKAHGKQVDITDLTRGRNLMANEVAFVAERLLAHTFHEPELDSFLDAMQTIDAVQFEDPQSILPLTIQDLAILTQLIPEVKEIESEESEAISDEVFTSLIPFDPVEEQIYDV